MDYLRPVLISGGEELPKGGTADQNIIDLLGRHKGLKKSWLKYMIRQARASVRNREFSKSMGIKILGQFKMHYDCIA